MKHIMICEDDPGISELFVTIFSDHPDYAITALSNCDELLSQLEKQTVLPDLLLLDLWIHEKDSSEIIPLIRQNEKFKDIPIFLASASPSLERIAKRLKVDDFLYKPFLIEELESKVAALLQESGKKTYHQTNYYTVTKNI